MPEKSGTVAALPIAPLAGGAAVRSAWPMAGVAAGAANAADKRKACHWTFMTHPFYAGTRNIALHDVEENEQIGGAFVLILENIRSRNKMDILLKNHQGGKEMPNRIMSSASVGIALGFISLTALPATGQVANQVANPAPNAAATYSPPRTPDGHPDLQGTYDLATMTPLERWPGDPPFLTKEQAVALQRAEAERRVSDGERIPLGGAGASPPKSFFEALEKNAGGATGGYNRYWLDQGTAYTEIGGQFRTSILTDPPDGHLPPYTEAARRRMAAARANPASTAPERQDNANFPPPGAYDNPEQRPGGERCLFFGAGRPPILPNYFYNDVHQIVQTPDNVMILTEMIHDARIVRMNAQHLPKAMQRWMGDSVGHWEGDTLVIDTINFNDKTHFRGSTQNLHVVERLTRINDRTLLYRFTIEDPDTWERPWTGEYAWPATTKRMYEYACHEANYALSSILRGARRLEAEQATADGKR